MSLALYGAPGTGAAAIEMALDACGLAYELRSSPDWTRDPRRPELLALNPLGQLPTLRLKDGQALTESAAILIHLGLAHPTAALLPADPQDRAGVLDGLLFLAANLYPAVGIQDYPGRWSASPEPAVLDALRQGTRRRAQALWEVFADRHGARLAGEASRPGALAMLTVVIARWSGARDHLAEHRPAFRQTLTELARHPRIAPVYQRHWTIQDA